ncbi:hypothetical protein [uncultured Microscilla sp.]|uniref:hypothetical protein n=1 Tax=uncultured Microscilla sp. TaxID=432653 RepID=UPI0026154900|nr:hypothetical protein [uncultured Microscilla sp.]
MMNRLLSTLLLVLIASGLTYAQDSPAKSRFSADLGLSVGAQQYGGHAWLSNMHFLGAKRKIGIGYGIRWSSYFGTDQNFTSAPPEFAGKAEKEGTLTVANAQINSLNLAIFLQYNITSKLEAGFNIDAIGFSFGDEQASAFAPPGTGTSNTAAYLANPTSTNLLLVGANDRGSLYSEFFVRYKLNDRLAIKAAFSYYFLEYTTSQPIAANDDNDRFRNSASMVGLGVSYTIK